MTRRCTATGCTRETEDHRWGKTKAHADGWFEQMTGDVWCPDHVPDWVAAWRARQARKGRP